MICLINHQPQFILWHGAQVGQSFAAGLDSAMGNCISGGSSATQCCGVVHQVRIDVLSPVVAYKHSMHVDNCTCNQSSVHLRM
jgi:hypothetical protein